MVRMLGERLRQHRVRRGVVAAVAQELRLGLPHLHPLLDRDGREVREIAPRFGDLVLLPQHRRGAQLRDPSALAVRDGTVALEREVVARRLLGDLREVELDAAVLVVVRLAEVLEQLLRGVPVLHLHGERRDRELVVAVRVVRGPEALEDRARLGVALLLDVELRERSRRRLRIGVRREILDEIVDRLAGRAFGRGSRPSASPRVPSPASGSARGRPRAALSPTSKGRTVRCCTRLTRRRSALRRDRDRVAPPIRRGGTSPAGRGPARAAGSTGGRSRTGPPATRMRRRARARSRT